MLSVGTGPGAQDPTTHSCLLLPLFFLLIWYSAYGKLLEFHRFPMQSSEAGSTVTLCAAVPLPSSRLSVIQRGNPSAQRGAPHPVLPAAPACCRWVCLFRTFHAGGAIAFVSRFFHSAERPFRVPPACDVPLPHSSWLRDVPSCGWTTLHLPTHPSGDI